MNILFWLNKNRIHKSGLIPLMFRITIDGNRINLPTGINIEENQWNHVIQRVKTNCEFHLQYNNTIVSMISKIWEFNTECIRQHLPVTSDNLKNYLLYQEKPNQTLIEAIDYYINQLKNRVGNDIAPNTVKKYETCKRKVEEFLKVELNQKDILLCQLSQKFIFQFDAFLRTYQKLHHNAVAKNMQQFKRVIKVAIQNEWLPKDPFSNYTCSPKETERGFLTIEEVNLLEAVTLDDRLDRVRDIFLFCCYTGLAYADVSKLNKEHLMKDEAGSTWIILSRTKSKSQSLIPLLPQAEAILSEYAEMVKEDPYKRLLPIISNQNLNKYIKEVAVIVGIKKRVSCHLARHTFATTITLNRGVDIVSVSKMLGHKNLRTTQIYAKIGMLKIASDMKKLM